MIVQKESISSWAGSHSKKRIKITGSNDHSHRDQNRTKQNKTKRKDPWQNERLTGEWRNCCCCYFSLFLINNNNNINCYWNDITNENKRNKTRRNVLFQAYITYASFYLGECCAHDEYDCAKTQFKTQSQTLAYSRLNIARKERIKHRTVFLMCVCVLFIGLYLPLLHISNRTKKKWKKLCVQWWWPTFTGFQMEKSQNSLLHYCYINDVCSRAKWTDDEKRQQHHCNRNT